MILISNEDAVLEMIRNLGHLDYTSPFLLAGTKQAFPLSVEEDLSQYNYLDFSTDVYPTWSTTIDAMDRQGYRPANMAELFYFVHKVGEVQNLTERDFTYPDREGKMVTKLKWYWLALGTELPMDVGSGVVGWGRNHGHKLLGLKNLSHQTKHDGGGFALAIKK